MTNFFNSLDNTNKSDLLQASENPEVKRSVLPYGRTNAFTFNEGAIVPLDFIPIIPGDSVDINFDAVMSCLNPFKDKMFSGMKLSIHAYYQKYEHEWTGWKNYATEGRRGNQTLSLPFYMPEAQYSYLHFDGYPVKTVASSDGTVPAKRVDARFDSVGSLCGYLTNLATSSVINGAVVRPSITINSVSVPPSSIGLGDSSQVNRSYYSNNYDLVTNSVGGEDYCASALYRVNSPKMNAIPFAIYQRIYRDYYLNKNLCKDNPLWFPDDEDDFVIPYAPSAPTRLAGQITAIGRTPDEYFNSVYQTVPNNHTQILGQTSTPYDSEQYADAPILGALRYRQFDGDLFTTGLPFLERGGTTKLWQNLILAAQTLKQDFTGSVGIPDGQITKTSYPQFSGSAVSLYNPVASAGAGTQSNVSSHLTLNGVPDLLGVFTTWNQIAELGVMQLWSRRNAQSDGDYNSLIRAHYGVNPKSQDRRAQYLGGAIIRLNFDNVVQNSESGNTPLGYRVALASGAGSGSLGHYEFMDFGAILIVGSLIPDTFYTQGLRPWFDADEKSIDLPYPEFTSLPRASVPLKRVYFDASANDLILFNYNERFLEYKYRDNVLSGHLLNFKDLKWSAMSFARYFDTAPVFNNEFVTASPYNLRSNMYTVPSQPHWIMQFADSIRLVRALPYVNKEATLNM